MGGRQVEQSASCNQTYSLLDGSLYFSDSECDIGDILCMEAPTITVSSQECCDNNSGRFVLYRAQFVAESGGGIIRGEHSDYSNPVYVCPEHSSVTLTISAPQNQAATHVSIFRQETTLTGVNKEHTASSVDVLVATIAIDPSTNTVVTSDASPNNFQRAVAFEYECGCPPENILDFGKTIDGVYWAVTSDGEIRWTIAGMVDTWDKSRSRAISAKTYGNIVKAIGIDTNVYVFTDNDYILRFQSKVAGSGDNRAWAMSRTVIRAHTCVSRDSVAIAKNKIFFAAKNGLGVLEGDEAAILTLPSLLSEKQWAVTIPEKSVGAWCNGAYYYSTPTDGIRFEIEDGYSQDRKNINMVMLNLGGTFVDSTDVVCYNNNIRWANSGEVYEIDFASRTGAGLRSYGNFESCEPCCPYVYETGNVVDMGGNNFSAMQVHGTRASSHGVDIEHISVRDMIGTVYDKNTVEHGGVCRIKRCHDDEMIRLRIKGCLEIVEIGLASNLDSLANDSRRRVNT